MFDLKNRLNKVTKYIEPNIVFIGVVGAFGFPTYYVIWQYLFPQPYENLFLRIIGMMSFFPLMLFPLIPSRFKDHFHWYFLIFAIYAMPFFFSFMLIKSGFSFTWHMSTIASLFLLIIIAYDWLLITLMTLSGFLLACIAVRIFDGRVDFSGFHLEVMPIYLFSLFGGLLFNYRNELSNTTRLLIMKSMAASISHELRNPLNAINFAAKQLQPVLAKISDEEIRKNITEFDSAISGSIAQANSIINIILADLSEKPIEIEEFSILSANKILPEIVAQFTYNNDDEKQCVKVLPDKNHDFVFKAVPDRLSFIIFNLLKNALYYVKKYPNSAVIVGSETKFFNGKEWNVIYVSDTGPGIAAGKISKIFDDFFTSGKKGGTGLGLAFCKRNMKAFGGDIICESEVAEDEKIGQGKIGWTKFSLLFPQLSESEIVKIESESLAKQNLIDEQSFRKILQGKNVVLADDQMLNRMMTKNNLLNYGLNVTEASDGNELLEIYKKSLNENGKSSFDLIITDINMPPHDGDEAAKKIRKIEAQSKIKNHIPIIALSGNGSREDIEHFFDSGMDDYFIKGDKPEMLIKAVSDCLSPL